MIYYIAELISNFEDSEDKNTEENKKICFETILKLWKHRAYLPNGTRPFEQYEEAMRALSSLDPKNKYPRYYFVPENNRPSNTKEVQQWVEFGEKLDSVAKILISFSFQEACRYEKDKTILEFLEIIKDSIECKENSIISRIISNGIDLEDDSILKDEKISMLQERSEQLKAFEVISIEIRSKIDSQLEKLKCKSED